jgi:hypothetical protein
MILVDVGHPPGVVGLSCGELARYTEYHACFHVIQAPPASVKRYGICYETASNSISIIRDMRPKDEWVWIMDDDHAFAGDILIGLLSRQVDCVVPLYFQRKPPFWPVAYGLRHPDGSCQYLMPEETTGKTGLLPVVSAGKAGVLIRRPVLTKLAGGECPCPYDYTPAEESRHREHRGDCPWATAAWFEHKGRIGEDHVFFDKVIQAGVQPYVDLDRDLDHITPFKIRVSRTPEGEYVPEVDLYNQVRISLRMVTRPGEPSHG